MVSAVYVSNEFVIQEEQSIKEIRKAFARGKLRFSHWRFIGPGIEILRPEICKPDVHSIVYLNVDNHRVTPFATDEEVHNMFLILMSERKPISESYTSNNCDQQIINIDFPYQNS